MSACHSRMVAVLVLVRSVAVMAAPAVVENAGFRLAVDDSGGIARATLDDLKSGLRAAEGPMLHAASRMEGAQVRVYDMLAGTQAAVNGKTLVIRGRLAGLDVEHAFTLPADRPFLEERVVVRNPGPAVARLDSLRVGFVRAAADARGQVLPELAADRWVAVPFRHKATDPQGFANDFSVQDLLTRPGWEPRITERLDYSQPPSTRRPSEGWAWLHGGRALCILRFSQEHLLWSVVEQIPSMHGGNDAIAFGGAFTISGEPAVLSRLRPGERADLGVTRYVSVKGGYEEACRAFRDLLDQNGCRFPADYDPPVHWEQLYDMEGAWDDRPHRYTREALDREAAKGRAYHCEALYLDPGWDTAFATFIWGDWLGPRKAFIEEMRHRYNLAVSLHCPLATWMSIGWNMGPDSLASWPQAARRKVPAEQVEHLRVPAVRDGRRNLALLPAAKAAASSVFEAGKWPIHQVSHLNDGWNGNTASWIAGDMPAWAEVDLGSACRIGSVRLGNDHQKQYADRCTTGLRILVATEYAADSAAGSWHEVGSLGQGKLTDTQSFTFDPTDARWVRVVITGSEAGLPRLDEIEVYEADPASRPVVDAFVAGARRRPLPALPVSPRMCLGSKQYLDEAEQRLLANCADGAAFLMFDGTWWNGGCDDPDHGHPVPYRWEDHIRACVDLARRVHARYPRVLIEMHDMLSGGHISRPTPIYYKYGLPGSYDCNWGFELMWSPLADIREGRARTLYEYNLGCNVPVYLHVDLRKDNPHCLVLWWYASTCRHLGIGGTNPDPRVVAAEQAAMRRYHEWEAFFKRGEFVGVSEEIHAHVLPAAGACVINIFNLSDRERAIAASCRLADLGLPGDASLRASEGWARVEAGTLTVGKVLPAWGADVVQISPAP